MWLTGDFSQISDLALLASREGSVTVHGSSLRARDELAVSAVTGDIAVTAGQETAHRQADTHSRTLGTLDGDGYSATAGYRRGQYSRLDDSRLENGRRSALTSQRGNIIAQAGGDLSLSGTDIRAGKSVSLSGENVLMGVSRDTREGEAHSSHSQ